MIAVKARFDGEKVILPKLSAAPVGPVIVIFQTDAEVDDEGHSWLKGQESVFAKAWDNEEDAIYDKAESR